MRVPLLGTTHRPAGSTSRLAPAPGPWRRGALACAAAFVLASPWAAPPASAMDPDDITVETLPNGMRVVLVPDHSIPNLAMFTFFRVGSRNEHIGITGLSHFFEHMMFLGSRSYKPGEFDRTMEAAGGANNAFTAQDITCYQNWFPRSALETIFTLESDRVGWLAIDSTSVESERGVVASERRRSVEDNNRSLIDEENWAAAFKAHSYQWPVIGWMVDIENWKMKDLRKYFETYYAPNNATMVVVGDFERDELRALVSKYIAIIPRGPEPPKVTTAEPEQHGERRVEFRKQANLAEFVSSWHIPATSHPDYWPLRVLETMLLQGESSRLWRRLVEREQAALSVSGGFDYALDPTLFQIFVQVKDGVQTSNCEALVYDELARLTKEPPSDREMQKARNQLAANFYSQLETISGKAGLLGRADVYFGDPKAALTTVQRYEKVAAADIQRVLKIYFNDRNRTVTTLVPEAEEERKSDAGRPANAVGPGASAGGSR